MFALVEHIDRRHPPTRISRHGHQDPLESLDQRFDAFRIKQSGAEFHRPADSRGLTGRVQRSANENVKSIFAVGLSSGIWVICRSPNASSTAGSLCCPGRFCQANATWTSG